MSRKQWINAMSVFLTDSLVSGTICQNNLQLLASGFLTHILITQEPAESSSGVYMVISNATVKMQETLLGKIEHWETWMPGNNDRIQNFESWLTLKWGEINRVSMKLMYQLLLLNSPWLVCLTISFQAFVFNFKKLRLLFSSKSSWYAVTYSRERSSINCKNIFVIILWDFTSHKLSIYTTAKKTIKTLSLHCKALYL